MKPAGLSVLLRVTVSRQLILSEGASLASRFTLRVIVAVAVALAVVTAVTALALVALPTPPARAATAQLTIEVDRILSLTNEAVTLTIKGTVSEQLTNPDELVVRIEGPAEPSQVGQSDPVLPQAATVSQGLTPAGSGKATGGGGAGSETGTGPAIATIVLPADTLAEAGAYLLTVEAVSEGVTRASATVWLGKAAPREQPLDVAFVWPVALGVHRDLNGAFFDEVLEDAVAPVGESPDGLHALLDLAGRFPSWRFTLAVEPILLAQLRDMADGYARLEASGERREVVNDDPAVKNAGQTLAAFKNLEGMESVEIAVIPYAGPALGVLAAEGWRDGFQQIQLGKQELQQTLGLGSIPVGAYSPDLDMTTESLAYYGQASIDHVVVDGRLAADLTEQVAEGAVATRVRDTLNDRVTLVFADSRLRSIVAPPWDAGVFFAGVAAELASGVREALVITPEADFVVPPSSYLQTIGEVLSRLDWVQTRTLTSLLRAHAPTTRPVLFNRSAPGSPGYIEGSLLTSLRAAHAAVADLAAVADATRAPVERAHRLLYTAESRWWWHPQTSPQVASIGLAYAEEARVLAQGELDKARFAGASPTIVTGQRGTIRLFLDNGADYPFKVEVWLSGNGLTLPDGERLEVELQPGRTEVPVTVFNAEGAHRLDVLLVAGASTIDEWSYSVRFITVMTVLPWAVLAVVVIGGAAYAAFRWRRRKRRAHA